MTYVSLQHYAIELILLGTVMCFITVLGTIGLHMATPAVSTLIAKEPDVAVERVKPSDLPTRGPCIVQFEIMINGGKKSVRNLQDPPSNGESLIQRQFDCIKARLYVLSGQSWQEITSPVQLKNEDQLVIAGIGASTSGLIDKARVRMYTQNTPGEWEEFTQINGFGEFYTLLNLLPESTQSFIAEVQLHHSVFGWR